MKAVIMAGGQGTRLRPLTSNQPKPMLPIVNRPIMEHIILLLRRHGITDQIATVQFLGRMIRSYFGNGEDLGVQLTYATEETPLGTAGSVRNAQDALQDETFLVISGDALTDIDLTRLVDFHKQKGALATICLKSVENPLEFGIVITREDGSIDRFLEKPNWGQVFSDTINTGIYVLEPEIFEYIPEDTVYDFSQDLFPLLLDKGFPIFGYVAPPDEYWCDVGTPESYLSSHRDVLEGRVNVDIPGFKLGDDVWLGEGAEVDPGAVVEGPCVIGENCRIADGSHVRELTVLGANVVVHEGATLHRAIVQDNAYVGPATALRGCVIGKSTDVRRSARVDEGVVVGDDCSIGESAVINPGVRIYPFKTVEAGAIITKSIIWESRGVRTLFGARGVAGLINVDVTPEVVVRLALAYASTLKKGATVTASRDATRAARSMKRAAIAGLNMAGISCHDLELCPEPVARYYVHTRGSAGGMTMRTAAHDPQSILIRFVDPAGTDLDEGARRKIERAYYREEFRRAYAGELGELHYPSRALEYYTEGLLGAVDKEAVRSAHLKVVADYGFGSTSLVLPGVLGKLGCEVLAVNSAVDGSRSIPTVEEMQQRERRLADLVKSSGSDVGLVLDATGERLWLVDDSGTVCGPDRLLLLTLAMLASDKQQGSVALPVSTSREAVRLASSGGLEVTWTKTTLSALMDAAAGGDVRFAGNPDGDLIFPEFIPSPDAMLAFVRFLEYRARSGVRLSETVAGLPSLSVVHETVACPWESKGTVMRHMIEEAAGQEVDLTDGVKIFSGEDWVLVLPDPEQPLVHVWAEASTPREAGELAGGRIRAVRTVVG